MKKVIKLLIMLGVVTALIMCAVGCDTTDTTDVHTVTFDTCGGSSIASEKVENGKSATEPKESPEREGYEFEGWFNLPEGGSPYDFANKINEGTTIFAQWSAKKFNITFDTCGGSEVDSIKIAYGLYVPENIEEPTYLGYAFLGWFTTSDGDTEFDFSEEITKDTTLYAQWVEIEKHTIIFDTCGGNSIESVEVYDNSTATKPSVAPELEGFVFGGWFTTEGGDTMFDFSSKITKDTTLYARWNLDVTGSYYVTDTITDMFVVCLTIEGENFGFGSERIPYKAFDRAGKTIVEVIRFNQIMQYTYDGEKLSMGSEKYFKVSVSQCVVKILQTETYHPKYVQDKGIPMDAKLYDMYSVYGDLYCGQSLITAETLLTEDITIEIKVQSHKDAPYLGTFVAGSEYSDGRAKGDVFIFTEDSISFGTFSKMPYKSTKTEDVYTIYTEVGYLEYNETTSEMTLFKQNGTELEATEYSLVPSNVFQVTVNNVGMLEETHFYFITDGQYLVFDESDINGMLYEIHDEDMLVFDPATTKITENRMLTYVSLWPFEGKEKWELVQGDTKMTLVFDETGYGYLTIEGAGDSFTQYRYSYNLDVTADGFDITITYIESQPELDLTLTYNNDKIIDNNNNEWQGKSVWDF